MKAWKVFRLKLSLLAIGCIAAFFLVPGCANMVPPLGGPRDSLPPVLVKASPENFTTGFNGKTIVLEFDEYIQLDNALQEVVINPPADKLPDISQKLRSVVIKLKDTLQPNTTYSFQFGKAIKDVNENNPMQDFSYIFSTGTYIDSLTLGGKVLDAETGKPDSTLIVMLHRTEEDSAVAKKKPQYVTRPNGKGQFMFQHLPAGSFYVFALKDEGFKTYTSPQTAFAFWGPPVQSGKADTSVELRAFVEEKQPAKPAANGGITAPGRNRGKDQEQQKILKITPAFGGAPEQDLLSPLILNFSAPLKQFDTLGMVLADTNFLPVSGFQLSLDSTGTLMELDMPWKDNQHYVVLLAKNFAIDTLGNGNRADTIRFKTKAESEYGFVRVNFSGIDVEQYPVVQWVLSENVVESIPLTTNRLEIKLFKPGEYTMRILYDANKNGKWDTGNYWERKQPEKVIAIEQRFNIRANWENEFDVNY